MSKPKQPDKGANARLKAFIERAERLNEEIKATQDDRKEVFAEAKSAGFDPKIMKQIIRLRAMDEHERIDEIAMLAMYAAAVGLQLDLLDEAA